MPDPLDPLDRLADLDGTGLPPLASSSAVRARGEQRRRRARALAGTAAVAVVGVLAVSAVALNAPGGDAQRLGPAAPATRGPTSSPTPGRSDPRLAELLLSADDLSRALGGTWRTRTDPPRPATGYPTDCTGGDPPPGVHATHDGPAGRRVSQDLAEYPDEGSAERDLGRYSALTESCPGWVVLGGAGEEQAARYFGRQGDAPFVVVRVGRVLTAVRVLGEGPDRLSSLGDLVEAMLRAGDVFDGEPAAADWQPRAAYLSPSEASEAESPGFTDSSAEGDGGGPPVLDPCSEGFEVTADQEDAVMVRFTSRREAGGSALVQRVARFSDAQAARRAAQAYLERVARCPVRRDDPMGEASETRYAVAHRTGDLDGGVFTALVRRVPCRSEGCTDHLATYVLLARSGDGVAVAAYSTSEDGDPRRGAESLLEAIAAKLADATG